MKMNDIYTGLIPLKFKFKFKYSYADLNYIESVSYIYLA